MSMWISLILLPIILGTIFTSIIYIIMKTFNLGDA